MRQEVSLTPVYGGAEDGGAGSGAGPVCVHLRVGALSVLLDCGWTDNFDPAELEGLRALAPHVDAVLVSHPDLLHMGALPYARASLGLKAPVVCTGPAQKLGMMLLYDHYLSRQSVSDFTLFSLADIDAAFQDCVALKFYQPHVIRGPDGSEVKATPVPAGRMLGGAVWKLSLNGSGEELVYAMAFNHRSERLLNSAGLERCVRPRVLVADASTAKRSDVKRKHRDAEVGKAVQECFAGGGSVLMPVDAVGRVLELMVFLDEFWAANELEGFGLVLLTRQSQSMVEYAKGLLEWLSDSAVQAFEDNRTNPFSFKYLKLCRTVEEMQDKCPGQKLVLTSPASLSSGFSRELFADWAADVRNTVLFSAWAPPGSLAHSLQSQEVKFPVLHLTMTSKAPLEGEELQAHWEAQGEAGPGGEGAQTQEAAGADPMDEDAGAGAAKGGEGVSDAEGVEGCDGELLGGTPGAPEQARQQPSLSVAAKADADGGGAAPGDVREAAGLESDGGREQPGTSEPAKPAFARVFCEGFTPDPGAAAPMFPLDSLDALPQQVHPGRWDEFGELINPDDFRRARDPALLRASEAVSLEPEANAAADDFQELVALLESPSKVTETHRTLTLSATVRCVDYEGLSDGKAVVNQIQQVSPHRLILIHGSEEGAQLLKQMCHQKRICAGEAEGILTPALGERVDLTEDFASLRQFRLSDVLLERAHWQKLPGVKGSQVAWVEGDLCPIPGEAAAGGPLEGAQNAGRPEGESRAEAGAEAGRGESSERGQEGAAAVGGPEAGGGAEGGEQGEGAGLKGRALMLVPRAGAEAKGRKRHGVLIGNPQLADLRILLHAHGVPAEFGAETGVLRCGDTIAIRKITESSRLVLEGSLSSTYFKVRRLLYSQFVVI